MERNVVEKKYAKKEVIAADKHKKLLKDTGYKCCAPCPGATTKFDEKGQLGCARLGRGIVYITREMAQNCDGSAPLPKKAHHEQRLYPGGRGPAHNAEKNRAAD